MRLKLNSTPASVERVLGNAERETVRDYVGGSAAGIGCLRELALELYDVEPNEARPAEVAMILERGHWAEGAVKKHLRAMGWRFEDLSVQVSDRLAVNTDGLVVECPLPDIALPAIIEFKCVNKANFGKFVRHGMKDFPHYWAQVQAYQWHTGKFNPAVVMMTCADDMTQAHTLVPSVPEAGLFFSGRMEDAAHYVSSNQLPPRAGANPDCWTCRFCERSDFCWEATAPEQMAAVRRGWRGSSHSDE